MISVDTMVEVTLKQPDDFLKVKETLTRIGVASKKSNTLLSENLDADYIEILLRDKFLLGKKGETVYIIKNE